MLTRKREAMVRPHAPLSKRMGDPGELGRALPEKVLLFVLDGLVFSPFFEVSGCCCPFGK